MSMPLSNVSNFLFLDVLCIRLITFLISQSPSCANWPIQCCICRSLWYSLGNNIFITRDFFHAFLWAAGLNQIMSNRFETQFYHLTKTNQRGIISSRISIFWPFIPHPKWQKEKWRENPSLKNAKQIWRYAIALIPYTKEDRTKEGRQKANLKLCNN